MPAERDAATERLQRINALLEQLRQETDALHEEMRAGALNQREYADGARKQNAAVQAADAARRTRLSRKIASPKS